ncbi:MAG: Fic family protein [Nanoarchaeota archaeon]|nr:Fic family protein [Nanoarchaeota archaeon]
MSYTETQKRNNKTYYYRSKSIKKKGKVSKKRIYLGTDLSKHEMRRLEEDADKKLNNPLNLLLTKEQILKLEKIKRDFKKLPKASFNNRYEAFASQFTYNSNAIEGNTLNLQETAHILFENRTPEGKSLREINEVLNHKKALDYILSYKEDISKAFVCKIQEIVTKNTLPEDLQDQIGNYRTMQVYIRGSKTMPSKPIEIPMEMRTLTRWYNANKKTLHPLILTAYFHSAFEGIHPFADGNGRTGRLLLNFILHKNEFPMINIPNEKKLQYFTCLEDAQVRDNFHPIVLFLLKSILGERYI